MTARQKIFVSSHWLPYILQKILDHFRHKFYYCILVLCFNKDGCLFLFLLLTANSIFVWWEILLIVVGCVVAVIGCIVVFYACCCRKKIPPCDGMSNVHVTVTLNNVNRFWLSHVDPQYIVHAWHHCVRNIQHFSKKLIFTPYRWSKPFCRQVSNLSLSNSSTKYRICIAH